MEGRDPRTGPEQLDPPGELLAQISRTLVALHKEFYGKGPTKARTVVDENLVVCVMEGGFTRGERTLTEAGRKSVVTDQREAFQEALGRRFIEAVEGVTGRSVRSFMSGVDPVAEVATEVFLLEPFGEDEQEAMHSWAAQTRRPGTGLSAGRRAPPGPTTSTRSSALT